MPASGLKTTAISTAKFLPGSPRRLRGAAEATGGREDLPPGPLHGPPCQADAPPTRGGLRPHCPRALFLSCQCHHQALMPRGWNTEQGGSWRFLRSVWEEGYFMWEITEQDPGPHPIPQLREATTVFRDLKESAPATTWLYGPSPNLPAWVCPPRGAGATPGARTMERKPTGSQSICPAAGVPVPTPTQEGGAEKEREVWGQVCKRAIPRVS